MPPKPPPRTRPTPKPRQTPTPSIVPPPAIISPPTTIITPPKLPNTAPKPTPRPRPAINKPIYNRVRNPAPQLKSTLPYTTYGSQPNSVVIPTTTPYSNSPNIASSNLPNTASTTTNQDNTLTYVILGALVVGIIILKNKDI